MKKEKQTDFILDAKKMPRHIAIIMDGNGRWAKKKLLPRTMGHRAGMAALRKTVETCSNMGIPVLTVFAFSTENWKRPFEEVDYLMKLLIEFLNKEIAELHQENVRIRVLGDYELLPAECQIEIKRALELTGNNTGMIFNIAVNYGARSEILRGVRTVAEKLLDHEISLDDIGEKLFSSYLYTTGLPDPDLLIRTAGEKRISNFLLWQIAYSEIWVTDTLWPDFDRHHLIEAIYEYQQRNRKFGGLS
ncbi:MAG: isoprenyl transferase [Syntrophomonas sp.]